MIRFIRVRHILAVVGVIGLSGHVASAAPAHLAFGQATVTAGKIAPAFQAKDLARKTASVKTLYKKPAVLFFFCGCEHCHEVARKWSQFGSSGALDAAKPLTWIVFADGPEGAKAFRAETGLPETVRMFPDANMKVADQYKAQICPRAFVLDAKGTIRYTNDHADDQPQKAPADVIVSRTVESLLKTTKPSKKPLKRH